MTDQVVMRFRTDRGGYLLEQGAAHRALGQVYAVASNRSKAEVAFRRSIKVLGSIQSRPELAQTLLAYGQFKNDEDADDSKQILIQALELFRQINATGWDGLTRPTPR